MVEGKFEFERALAFQFAIIIPCCPQQEAACGADAGLYFDPDVADRTTRMSGQHPATAHLPVTIAALRTITATGRRSAPTMTPDRASADMFLRHMVSRIRSCIEAITAMPRPNPDEAIWGCLQTILGHRGRRSDPLCANIDARPQIILTAPGFPDFNLTESAKALAGTANAKDPKQYAVAELLVLDTDVMPIVCRFITLGERGAICSPSHWHSELTASRWTSTCDCDQ